MFSGNLNNKIEEALSVQLRSTILILSVKSVTGGSINDAYCLVTNNGKYFIKTNQANRYPNMFEREAKGLALLKNANTIRIPKVILFDEFEATSFLILEYIESTNPQPDFWQNFGKKLAELHQNTNTNFGLDHNNYIGSLHQQNNLHPTWVDFFINERLQPQIKLARDNNEVDSTTILKFENLYKKLDEVFPKEKPALLHGDLWSGNFMSDEKGESVIMDPAVYYGCREMDIAMARLFGGFDAEFYSSYNEYYPLENGWEQRIDVCNLYPLMVHVNLFGGGYLGQVKSILSKF
ncbi:MAG: fructosamine kinase family protein [Flavobacteriales bacterium]|nr:fructosamine kinase family protein [Flavobacteriales bacterium]